MDLRDLPVTIVQACMRDGHGGSPTAIVDETPLTDAERRSVPVLAGTSHAIFVSVDRGDDRPLVRLRFFTAEGELPACGHGTIAALAALAERAGGTTYQATLRTPERTCPGQAVRRSTHVEASYEAGHVDLREPTSTEQDLILSALGITAPTPGTRIASPGRPRILVPVPTTSALAALSPDLGRLRDACDRLGLLGCYAYSPPTATGRVSARMFAPSIGVPEDIANANSTACLAAHLATQGTTTITVDMGDFLGSPATITATAQGTPSNPLIHLGGTATLGRGAF
jgi:trans-2,3-dihydro-3-hydroxyanthranilate isomerase